MQSDSGMTQEKNAGSKRKHSTETRNAAQEARTDHGGGCRQDSYKYQCSVSSCRRCFPGTNGYSFHFGNTQPRSVSRRITDFLPVAPSPRLASSLNRTYNPVFSQSFM